MNSEKIGEISVNIFIILLGLFFTISSMYKIGDYISHKNQSIKTIGKVVKSGKGTSFGCRPFIEFYDDNNRKIEIRSDINYYIFFCPQKGDRVNLSYSKENPEITMVSSYLHNFLIPGFILIIGLLLLFKVFSRRVSE